MGLAFSDDGLTDELTALRTTPTTQLGRLSAVLAPHEAQIKETLARISAKDLVPVIKRRLVAEGARVPSDLTIWRYLRTLGGGRRPSTQQQVKSRWKQVQRDLGAGMPINKIAAVLAAELGRSPGTVEKAIMRIINTKTHDA